MTQLYQGETLGYGQGSPQERKYVYDVVVQNDYSNILECGTMEGGGTTYAIFRALQHLGKGKLTTYEIDHHRAAIASQKYKDYVEVKNETFENIKNINASKTVCMVMYDNIRDDDLNERLFEIAQDVIRPGGSLIIHDWTADHCHLFLKKIGKRLDDFLKETKEWELITVLNNTTGLAHFRKKT